MIMYTKNKYFGFQRAIIFSSKEQVDFTGILNIFPGID